MDSGIKELLFLEINFLEFALSLLGPLQRKNRRRNIINFLIKRGRAYFSLISLLLKASFLGLRPEHIAYPKFSMQVR